VERNRTLTLFKRNSVLRNQPNTPKQPDLTEKKTAMPDSIPLADEKFLEWAVNLIDSAIAGSTLF
jgi:hypothetical protein